MALGFHQDFSSDHPAKGQTVLYSLTVHNQLLLPLASMSCRFTYTGPGSDRIESYPLHLLPGASAKRDTSFRCAYRGIYAIGADCFSFRDALGILEFEHLVEPRIFYVYPELARLGPRVEGEAEGGGEGLPVAGGRDADPGVFDMLNPVVHGRGARRLAWKRFAATGLPSEIAESGASAYGLRVVLDLRPSLKSCSLDDRLAAEDLAVTTVFSVLLRLVERGIPADLVLGGEDRGMAIEDRAAFDAAYAHSTNILFTDERFPGAAFQGGRASLVVSVRSIVDDEGERDGDMDLFEALESALAKAYGVQVLTVPPPSFADTELARTAIAGERLYKGSSAVPCRALDSRRGIEGVVDAFIA
jgi:hypothetical protein